MANELFTKTVEQARAALTPIVKANRLVVANLEKVVEFQLNALPSYVDLGLGQLRAAAEITEPKDLQTFYVGQVEAAKVLRQQLLADSKALIKLGNDFVAELNALARTNGAEPAPAAAA